jgi:hypothetical protein
VKSQKTRRGDLGAVGECDRNLLRGNGRRRYFMPLKMSWAVYNLSFKDKIDTTN